MTTTPKGPEGFDRTGIRALRRYHEATVVCADRSGPIRFVIESATGCVILPADPVLARSDELVLLIPEESACVLQVGLSPTIILRPESEESVDRWAGYHGKFSHNTWVRCEINGAKADTAMFDPEELMLPNTLRTKEFALIKSLNTDQGALTRACRTHGHVDVSDPLAVGVDPFGVDVKARFGIVRLEFPENVEARSAEHAVDLLDWLLGKRPLTRGDERSTKGHGDA